MFSTSPPPGLLQSPHPVPGATSQYSYLGAEYSKRNGNGINHLASADPSVVDHTLPKNLAGGSGSSGNLILLIARPVGSSPDLGQVTGGMECSTRTSCRLWSGIHYVHAPLPVERHTARSEAEMGSKHRRQTPGTVMRGLGESRSCVSIPHSHRSTRGDAA